MPALALGLSFRHPFVMDLLAGYESDASGSSDSQQIPAEAPVAAQVKPSLPSWASKPSDEQAASLLHSLPNPSSRPARKTRRTVPMTLQYVPDSDEEVGQLAVNCC